MKPTVYEIQMAACQIFGVTMSEIQGPRTAQKYARPRMLAMAVARELNGGSFPDIGRRFGGRNHATVIHAVRADVKRCAEDPSWIRDRAAIVHAVPGVVEANRAWVDGFKARIASEGDSALLLRPEAAL